LERQHVLNPRNFPMPKGLPGEVVYVLSNRTPYPIERPLGDWHDFRVIKEHQVIAKLDLMPGPNGLEVADLWVAEKHRNQAVGSALIELAKNVAREARLWPILVPIRPYDGGDAAALAQLFQRHGFTLDTDPKWKDEPPVYRFDLPTASDAVH
jgi:GNAT superfamily N-acetyltransferase